MTIEEVFFKTFGIETQEKSVPEITDRILLELIVILSSKHGIIATAEDVEALKRKVIETFIQVKELLPLYVQYKIQSLFGMKKETITLWIKEREDIEQ